MSGGAVCGQSEIGLGQASSLAPPPQENAERKVMHCHGVRLPLAPSAGNDLRGQFFCAIETPLMCCWPGATATHGDVPRKGSARPGCHSSPLRLARTATSATPTATGTTLMASARMGGTGPTGRPCRVAQPVRRFEPAGSLARGVRWLVRQDARDGVKRRAALVIGRRQV